MMLLDNIPASLSNENLSLSEIGFVLGYSERWLYNRLSRDSNWLKSLKELGFNGELISLSKPRESTRGASTSKVLSNKDFKILVTYESCLGNPKASQLLVGNKINLKKRFSKQDEKRIKLKIANQLNGRTEVITEIGNIDVLTDEEIIEVKNWLAWKSALGQVLAYSHYYPEKLKRIHCFGKFPVTKVETIRTHLNVYHIKLTWEI